MPECHQQTACDDQAAAKQDGGCWLDVKSKKIDDLCRDKEKADINPEQPAKVPTRRIDDDAISREHTPAQNNQAEPLCQTLRVKAGSYNGVTTSLKQSRKSEDEEGDKV